MAQYPIYPNQLFVGKSWNGYTSANHLQNVFAYDPIAIAQKLEQIARVDLGEDFVSYVNSFGTYYIESDKKVVRWYLENNVIENYELLGAYDDRSMTNAAGTTPGIKLGANGTSFFMLFKDCPFRATEKITGNKPDIYQFWIINDPINISGNRYLYEVKLVHNDPNFYVPAAEVAPGVRFSNEGGLIPDEKSDRGFDISFKSNSMLESTLSRFRMQHEISSNAQDIKPLYFFITDAKGNPAKVWLSNIEYEFYRKMRWVTASLIMYGKSTVGADGQINLMGENGFPVSAGSGFREQWSTTNLHQWSVAPDLDELTEIALACSIGKYAMNQRKLIVYGGEFGLVALANMVTTKFGANAYTNYNNPLGDTTGRAYRWEGNDIYGKLGQFKGVATINGIEFIFAVDPSKDDLKRHKLLHPLGGPAASYEYDIMGLGASDAKSNMQIVRRKDKMPQFSIIDGPLGFFKGGASFSSPKSIATAVEGSVMHYIEPGVGSVVWDPSKVIRYYPTITRS